MTKNTVETGTISTDRAIARGPRRGWPRTLLGVSLLALACGAGTACIVELGQGAAMGFELEREGEGTAALTTRCAQGTTLRGIDVSVFQGLIDWSAVRNDGVRFAFIRVSDGIGTPDELFDDNWSGARQAGVRRGVYQFFRPSQDPIAQADLLVDAVGTLEEGDLPPVLDLETRSGQSAATVQARAQQWLDRVEARLGVRPILYTGPYFWRDQVGAPAFGAAYPLWVAHYTSGCPLTPEPWTNWTFHQHSDSGSVAGIAGPVDVNRFQGTEADLAALAVGAPSAPQCVDDSLVAGATCAPGCIWSTWAVANGLQTAIADCQGNGCACVEQGRARQACAPASCDTGPPPSLEVLAPADGSVVENPVVFTFEGEGIARVDVTADGYPFLSFDPGVDGWTHEQTFLTTGVSRLIRAEGKDASGNVLVVKELRITPLPAPDQPTLTVLAPTSGASVQNPVTFSFAGANVARVRVFAEQWQILDFDPAAEGWEHTYSFTQTGVSRALRAVGLDSDDHVLVERTFSITPLPAPGSTTRAGLAQALLNHHHAGDLTLWDQNFGHNDGADPLQNVEDTAAGGPALTSCHGTAPCTSVYLDVDLLLAMRDLREQRGYTYFVTSIAGASHSAGSLHYAGRAVDVDEVNGVRIIHASSAAITAFSNACWDLGAIEVFNPLNDPVGHNDHIHCGF